MILAQLIIALALALNVYAEVALDTIDTVRTCLPISINWRNGDSDAALSIDLYKVEEGSDISWYTQIAREVSAISNHYEWSPSQDRIRSFKDKAFVYKFSQEGERDVYSNQFEFSRCRRGWPGDRRADSNSAAIAGGILGALAAIGLLTIAGLIVVRRQQAHEDSKLERDLELRPLTQRSHSSMPNIPAEVYHPRSAATSFNSSTAPPPYSAIYEDFNSNAHPRLSQPPKVRRKPVPSADLT